MIENFRCKETERIFCREGSRKLPQDIQAAALRKLMLLDAAEVLEDLRIPPSNHLEKLLGKRRDQYSIRVNKQWRICFEWANGRAYRVEMVDYH
ncbi:MAG: type II toxin-antitoxin system RelE/ParE family toxin [Chlamydiae bacterium]|nr:type II toxin-antitoxin system RelE/ParE family toxin [Chlamydiota bacterium]MBI3267084.1 type II toxin-antitoxin system RelE/ParE family toxin [Chlamydiota bacterium]